MKKLSRLLPVLGLLLVVLPPLHAESRTELAAGFQVYPTGGIGALQLGVPLGESDLLTARVGFNSADRDDNGDRDDEEGDGPGFSLGYRRDLSEGKWFVGGRVDVWWLEIDWIDNPGLPAEIRGTTDIVVLQPTVEAGYRVPLGRDGRWILEPNVAFGFEINVDTDGRDVGEGPILLGGLSVAYRF